MFYDCEHIHSVNPLYLLFHSATGYFKEENGKKKKKTQFLIQQRSMKKFFLESYRKLKQLMVEKNCFMKKIMLELELIQMMTYL